MTNKKKMALAGVLVLVMVVSAIGGTLAWLTDTSHVDNVFMVGAFTQPTDPKPDPDPPKPDPDDPDPPKPSDEDMGRPEGFIFEPYWNANGKDSYAVAGGGTAPGDKHRLEAGAITVKDPYIGIGKDSESGYVLACITNPMGDNVYFTLCDGWAPVEGSVKEVTITDDNSSPSKTTGTPDSKKYYSAGLFKWVGTANGNNSAADLAALTPDTTTPADVWTDNPVFTYVYTAKDGMTGVRGKDAADRKMTVWAYIHQTKGKADESNPDAAIENATTTDVVTAATAWAKNTASGYPGLTITTTP